MRQFSKHPQPVPRGPSALLSEVKTLRSIPRFVRYLGKPQTTQANGQAVMTLPGIGFGDEAMYLMRRHLRKLGFTAYGWNLGTALGSVPDMIPKVAQRVRQLNEATGGPIALVGWSLGGYLAREVARENPELVAQIVTLASPIRGGPKYTAFSAFYARAGMDIDATADIIDSREVVPIDLPITCIYSKNDGVVDWRAVADFWNPQVTCIEVDATHSAMGFDPIVLEHTANALVLNLG